MSDLLLSYYADDFTGSTDVMESLSVAGVPTVLFVDAPSPDQIASYPHARAVGVAGLSRAMSVEQMERHLPRMFQSLAALGTPLVHYKTCSTFDSSPTIGSIGRAIELAHERLASKFVPIVVGAPILGRYCVFGNLFARSGLDSPLFRLDRHPTMRQHPVTPMDEADLVEHLAKQTQKRIALFDVLKLEPGNETTDRAFVDLMMTGPEIVMFDTLTDRHLETIGRLLWSQVRDAAPMLVVGSSGVEYALAAHWRSIGVVEDVPPIRRPGPVDQIAVVSGSCSPVTAQQIEWALARQFAEIALNTVGLVDSASAETEMAAAASQAIALVRQGKSVILHTACGPGDPRIGTTRERLDQRRQSEQDATLAPALSDPVGSALGEILRRLVEATGLRRIAVAGGDSSGFIARTLGVQSLELVAPLAPGSPLCRVHAPSPIVDGMEMTFKGGQVGKIDFFGQVLQGGA